MIYFIYIFFFQYTIGTFSWLQGNPYPSVTLVTIKGNSKQDSIQEWEPEVEISVCFLPNQRKIYFAYILLIIMSLFIVILDPLNPDRRKRSVLILSKYKLEMIRLLFFRVRSALQKVFLHIAYLILFYILLVWLST